MVIDTANTLRVRRQVPVIAESGNSTADTTPAETPTGRVPQASQCPQISQGVWHARTPAVTAVRGYGEQRDAMNVSSSAKMGTVMGVIFPCLSNILGVILFIRLPLLIGKAGIIWTFVIVLISCLTTLITALSLSAVSTNGKILGGGSYFLISRSLGPSLGTGVGLCFYCANSVGAALYILGTVEAWDVAYNQLTNTSDSSGQLISHTQMRMRVFGWIILLFCFLVCSVSVKFVSKLGTFFLFIVLLVICSMYLGLFIGPTDLRSTIPLNTNEPGVVEDSPWKGLSFENFNENIFSAYSDDIVESKALLGDSTVWDFFVVLAIWFPACTGIMAGSNRSADLKEPSKSIPFGTLFAQALTSVIYVSFIFLYGAACSRAQLLNQFFIPAFTAWPYKYFVIFGVMASTIGAALASLTSAARLLDAIAKDRTLPPLASLGSTHGKEPRKALLVSCSICFIAIAPGDLNSIAPLLTMFFLMCYFCINMSCAMLDLLNDPNWRPTFHYHHVLVSITGMALCLFLMFAIQAVVAVIAIFLCSLIFLYVTSHSHEINWGDGFQGMKFQVAKMLLRDCDARAPHSKNWRPQILVLTGLTVDRDMKGLTLHDIELVHLASQLKAGKGLTIVGGIITVPDLGRGSFLSKLSSTQIQDWSQVVHDNMKELGIAGFARCVYAANLGEGILSLIQTAGLGAFQPNCVMVSWPFSWVVVPEARVRFIQAVQTCSVFEKVILVCKEGHKFPLNGRQMIKGGFMDIWWVVADGGIMLLIAFLLQKHEVWRGCNIRLFAIIDTENDDPVEVKKELVTFIQDHRLPVSVRTVAMESHGVFNQNMFSDFTRRMHTREAIYASMGSQIERNPFDNIFLSAQRLRHYCNGLNTETSEGNLRRNAFTDPGPKNPVRMLSDRMFRQENDMSPLADIERPSMPSHIPPVSEAAESSSSPTNMKPTWVSSFAMDKQRLISNTPCAEESLSYAKALNEAIRNQSADSELVVTNLPDVPDNESAFGYMQFLEHLTAGLDRVLLVRGTAGEVISAFT